MESSLEAGQLLSQAVGTESTCSTSCPTHFSHSPKLTAFCHDSRTPVPRPSRHDPLLASGAELHSEQTLAARQVEAAEEAERLETEAEAALAAVEVALEQHTKDFPDSAL